MALQSTIAISTITLQTISSIVTFSSIPNIYRDLILIISGTAAPSGEKYFNLYLNGDTGANYSRVEMTGTPSSGTFANLIPITLISSNQGSCILTIFDYAQTNKHKTALYRNNTLNTAATPIAGTARWTNTTAISSLTIDGFSGAQLNAGTTISLYGRIA